MTFFQFAQPQCTECQANMSTLIDSEVPHRVRIQHIADPKRPCAQDGMEGVVPIVMKRTQSAKAK